MSDEIDYDLVERFGATHVATDARLIKLGDELTLKCGNVGVITEVFFEGFNYHTIDEAGNCIKGQRYCLRSNYENI